MRIMQEKGYIFNIQHFSIHDGPGIRTTVFLKGCPLRCPWCSNPESQRFKPEPMLDPETKKPSCVGEEKSVDEIIEDVVKDIDFYEESGGGLTLSGGEPLAQFGFARAILKRAKQEHIHTALETTAYVDHQKFVEILNYVDFIYTDLKHYDPQKHRSITAVDNELIIKNISYAFTHNIHIVLRIPVIPDFNNSLEDAAQFGQLFKKMHVNKVQLLPFHQFGENKYKLLKRVYQMGKYKPLHPEDLYDYRDVLCKQGIDCYL